MLSGPIDAAPFFSFIEQDRRDVDEVKGLFLEGRCVQNSFTTHPYGVRQVLRQAGGVMTLDP